MKQETTVSRLLRCEVRNRCSVKSTYGKLTTNLTISTSRLLKDGPTSQKNEGTESHYETQNGNPDKSEATDEPEYFTRIS